MVDEQKLRQLADAATPGPWEQDRRANLRVLATGDATVASCGTSDRSRDKWECNAAFIAAANPAAILSLLDELQAMREERTAWRVTSENAEPDAARYRWLRAQHWEKNKLGVVVRPKDNTKLGCFLPSGTLLDDTIDHMIAIDAAMKDES